MIRIALRAQQDTPRVVGVPLAETEGMERDLEKKKLIKGSLPETRTKLKKSDDQRRGRTGKDEKEGEGEVRSRKRTPQMVV